MIDHLALALGRPSAGWLPVHLQLGDFVLDCAASNVLNDPVEELLDLLEYAVDPRGPSPRVCFWLEPEGYAIDVEPLSAVDRRIIRIGYAPSFVPPMTGKQMSPRWEGELEAAQLASVLFASLSTLLEGPAG